MNRFFSNAKQLFWLDDSAFSIFQTNFDASSYSEELTLTINPGYEQYLHKATVKRKSEFLAGRYCAQESLKRWQVQDEIIGIGEGRHPIWPAGIVGSISHCHAYAVAVTAKVDNVLAVGLDAEDVAKEETINEIMEMVVNQNEIVLIKEPSRRDVVFTVIFSMKESFFKAVYPIVGFYFDFQAISIIDIDWKRGSVLVELNQQLHMRFRKGSVFSGQFQMLTDDKVITLFQIKA